MTTSFQVTGLRELAQTLKALEAAVSREIQLQALMAGAELIRADAAALAPRSDRSTPHLADDIVIGAPSVAQLERRGAFDEVLVEVGPSKKPHDHFYGYFQEYGTLRHRAQPFMRPAFDRNAQASLDRSLAVLWKAVLAVAAKGPQA